MKQAIYPKPIKETPRNQAINRLLAERNDRELQLAAELAVYKGLVVFVALLAITKIGGWQ